jgi:hypothetical protein
MSLSIFTELEAPSIRAFRDCTLPSFDDAGWSFCMIGGEAAGSAAHTMAVPPNPNAKARTPEPSNPR